MLGKACEEIPIFIPFCRPHCEIVLQGSIDLSKRFISSRDMPPTAPVLIAGELIVIEFDATMQQAKASPWAVLPKVAPLRCHLF